jgi:hypothetical protein
MPFKSYILILFLFLSSKEIYGQVFTNASTAALGIGYGSLANTIAVTGLPTSLNGTTIGLQQVEVTITANAFTNIELFLISPDNRMIRLFSRLPGVNTLNGTFTFNMAPANPAIRYWTAVTPPPAAPFLPDVSLNSANDGSNPNGTWKLFGKGIGNSVTNFKLTFGTANISPTITNDDCSAATPLINTLTAGGFISGTNIGYGSTYNIDNGSYVCSTSPYTENTAWYSWIASCANDSIVIMTNGGVQTGIVKGTCGTAMTLVQCNGQYVTYHTYKSLGLTPGTKYYLLFDGDEALGVTYEIRWYPGGCSLPVTLLYLNAAFDPSSSLINVNWETAMENNNKGFHIEARLVSGPEEFTETGFVPAAANPESGADYSFNFKPQSTGLYEIRLVQEDMDGTKTTSPSSFVTVANETESLEVYYSDGHVPNAVFYLTEPETINYDLINLNGIKILSSTMMGHRGNNQLDISYPLPPAVYFLQVTTREKATTKKIVILK